VNSTAFSILGIDIRWYGILIASGMILGIIVAKYTSKYRNINYDNLLDTIMIVFPLSIIGARLYYVLFEFDYYRNNLGQIFNIREGGLAIHGGLIFGLLAAILYTRAKRLNFLSHADVAVPSIVLAQAIGRWGNFFNQEAHGGPVSYEFIKKFPDFIQKGMFIEGSYFHPTFLYESLWNFCIFIVLIIILVNSKKIGIVFFTYIGLYSAGRFIIEGLRTDSLMLGSIRVAQLISLLGFVFWIIYLVIYYRNKIHK
jgi:phosphatidylglycerol:prolipoprotein diacylglycerol transferase